ncbi:MAG TPA: hypothetical protein DCE78_10380 [Bacteroidetes bacterium]|nr:hypothetical protein [Bacteroidota bacterium]
MKTKLFLFIAAIFIATTTVIAQDKAPTRLELYDNQSYDENYVAPTPMRPANTGTTIYVDAAHNNFHTYDGRFTPFSNLVRNDGFNVAGFNEKFTPENLAGVKILVIANPVNDSNTPEANWVTPVESAFTDDEIDALVDWVNAGGSLLLIADHFPFPGAVDALASRFGFQVDNGYNFDPEYYNELEERFFQLPIIIEVVAGRADPSDNAVLGQIMSQAGALFINLGAEVNSLSFWNSPDPGAETGFQSGDGTIIHHELMANGAYSYPGEPTPFVTTFTGQSFDWSPTADIEEEDFHPLFILGDGTYTVMTEAQDAYFGPTANVSDMNTLTSLLTTGHIPAFIVPVVESDEKLQAAIAEVGSGKVAFFGEAGMFTAQIASDGVTQMGINNPNAAHNWMFILNLMRYLDGFDVTTVSTPETSDVPLTFELFENYPNPFNPSTNISFSLPESDYIQLEVFDLTGRVVTSLVNGTMSAGTHNIKFDAGNLANGIYLYRLTGSQFSQTNKMMLIK